MSPRKTHPAHRERVEVHLDALKVVLLDVLAEHLALSRDETVAEALNALFVSVYRPGD